MDRFWAKVDKGGPAHPTLPNLGRCWMWKAAKSNEGYGKIWSGGSAGDGKLLLAHRFSKCLDDGSDINRPELCLHTCDNSSCVNPDHLYWGSYSDNNIDSVRRSGRKCGYDTWEYCGRGHFKGNLHQCKTCASLKGIIRSYYKAKSEGRVWRPYKKSIDLLNSEGLTIEKLLSSYFGA